MADEKGFFARTKQRWVIVTSILGAVVLIGTIWKGTLEFDSYYAKAADVKEEILVVQTAFRDYQAQQTIINENVIQRQEAGDRRVAIKGLQQRIWDIETHYMQMKQAIPLPVQRDIQLMKNEILELQGYRDD